MDDQAIIALYLARDPEAIAQTDLAYGPFCTSIAMNLLGVSEDAQECVNDTYHAAWNQIPPDLPQLLRAYLGRITRNISISRFRRDHSEKRFAPAQLLLSELDDCVPDSRTPEAELEAKELGRSISRWLYSQSKQDRYIFIRRYWYGDSVKALSARLGILPNTISQRLRRMRSSLKEALEAEGVTL